MGRFRGERTAYGILGAGRHGVVSGPPHMLRLISVSELVDALPGDAERGPDVAAGHARLG